MQTKREYLISKGLAKPGRGKFSNAGNAALAEAERSGVKFSDTGPVRRPTVKSGPEISKTGIPAKNSDNSETGGQNAPYIFPSDFRFPEAEYVAVARDEDGKRILHSMRECCNTCKVSLTNHACDSPTIHDSVTVKIERR